MHLAKDSWLSQAVPSSRKLTGPQTDEIDMSWLTCMGHSSEQMAQLPPLPQYPDTVEDIGDTAETWCGPLKGGSELKH